jgi:hypothetical protein
LRAPGPGRCARPGTHLCPPSRPPGRAREIPLPSRLAGPRKGVALSRILALLGLLLTVAFYARILAPAFADPHHRPIGSDFDTFWAGASLALHGHAAGAWDLAAIRVAEAVGAQLQDGRFYVYLYPPTFLALSLPLAALPYLVALPAFLLSGWATLLAMLRRLLPPAWPFVALLAIPAAWLNAIIGQNGFFSALSFAAAAVWLDQRPMVGGACLGMLACKPHLAVCVPFALAAARRWRALAVCAGVAFGLVALSWLVLGAEAWRAFLGGGGIARAMLASNDIWPKMLSLYAAARLLGLGQPAAFVLQGALALLAVFCATLSGWRRPGGAAEVAVIVAAGMLCSPYIWDYDQVCLAVPLAVLAGAAGSRGWRPGEKLTLAGVFLMPVLARGLNVAAGLPAAPLFLSGLLWFAALPRPPAQARL